MRAAYLFFGTSEATMGSWWEGVVPSSFQKALVRVVVGVGMTTGLGLNSVSFGQATAFAERFAISENRSALLGELIPGTEEYFYYHTLHAQNEAMVAEARSMLDAWVAKVGMSEGAKRMTTRQMLLEYSKNPRAVADYLRREYGFQTSHPAPQKDEAAVLPSRLDSKSIDWKEAIESTVKNDRGIQQIEDALLPHVLPFVRNMPDLRTWISRIGRNDVPGLVDRLTEELKQADSQGFGWARIHRELTLEQLKQLQSKNPGLLQNGQFVNEMLRRIRVSDDESMQDLATRGKHLDTLETFVLTLPESNTSLIASVLYQRLEFDAKQGKYDRDRFLRYIQLPNNRPWISNEFRVRCQGKALVDFGAAFPPETLVRTIGNDSQLVQSYLEHFFQSDQNYDEFAKFLDRGFLKTVFAKTRILYGIGDSKPFYAQLTPEEQREIAARVEVKFLTTNVDVYRPSDRVRIELELKNVPELLVRIYRLNAKNILSRQAEAISTAIDLDGTVANTERRLEYAQRPDLRHRETIELPELEGMGVWVVECLAGGKRSRALIHKGHLQSIPTLSDVGHILRIVNAEGDVVPTARVLLGEREFAPEEDGSIIIPFDDQVRTRSLVLFDGNFAVVEPFVHLGEAYELRANFLMEQQSVLSGSRTAVVIRPRLLSHGQPIPLSSLEQAELKVTTTDLEEIVSTQTFTNLKFDELEELVQPFLVPPRLASLRWELSGKVMNLRTRIYENVQSSSQISVNGLAKTGWMHDLYLTRTDVGYSIEARGRNGEPCARVPLQLEFKLFGLVGPRSARLATNENGIVDLGRLAGVVRISVSGATAPKRDFPLVVNRSDWPERIQVAAGDKIELPIAIWDHADLERALTVDGIRPDGPRVALTETRGGIPYADVSERVKSVPGGIRIEGLAPGNYVLTDHRTQTTSSIWVTDGEDREGMIVGKNRTLMRTGFSPLRIENVVVADGKIRVKLEGQGLLTRVHVIGTAYEHLSNEGWEGRSIRLQAPAILRRRLSSFYLDSLQLDEEYQYVLARQLKKPLLGSMLVHPSVLLNPWEISSTMNTGLTANAGDAIADFKQEAMQSASNNAAPKPASDPGAVQPEIQYDYEFLERASAVVPNLRPKDDGWVELDVSGWEGLTSISIVAIHPSMTASRRIGLPLAQPRTTRERRLQESLDVKTDFVQNETVRTFAGGDPLDLGDAAMTKLRTYDSIHSLLPMMKQLAGSSEPFNRFDFLGRWPGLSETEKKIRYSESACHELHLFLYMHDRPFFDSVIQPYLRNKTPKQFMDDWLLDRDLSDYTQPWRLQQLNTVERVLLAKKLQAKSPGVQRWLSDRLQASPIPFADRANRFKTALRFLPTPSPDDAFGVMGTRNAGDVWSAEALMEEESLARFRLNEWSDAGNATRGLSKSRSELQMGKPSAPTAGGMPGSTSERFGTNGALKKDAYFFENGSDKEAVKLQALRDGIEQNRLSDRKSASAEKELGEQAGVTLGRRLKRGNQVQAAMFESLAATRKWAESNYDRLLLLNQNAEVISPSPFWLDYLRHDGNGPFLSENVHLAARNIHEALLALAVLGLPIESQKGHLGIEGDRWVLKDSGPCVSYIQGIVSADGLDGESKLLLSENFYLANADASAKSLDRNAMVAGVPYRGRVVMTNPTGNALHIQLLMQIPQGAIALEGGRSVTVREFDLAPFSTQETSHVFYFPVPGDFQHYGARASQEKKIIASQESLPVKVLDRPANVDDASWGFIASWGSNEQVLAALDRSNLAQIDLSAIAWRLGDAAFWNAVVDKLNAYGVYHEGVWAYALLHEDVVRVRELLEANANVVAAVGPMFGSNVMVTKAESRLQYEHLDFRPLVVGRSHLLGKERIITNDGMKEQFARFMQLLSYQPRMEPRHRLGLTYYLIADNRVDEAIDQFAKIPRAELEKIDEAVLQYDYFDAYLAMRRGAPDAASAIAQRYVGYPVLRWRAWFEEIQRQIAEREQLLKGVLGGGEFVSIQSNDGTQRMLGNEREQSMQDSAEQLPSLELVQEGDTVWIESRNLQEIRLNYYLIDVELMFSRNPFLSRTGSRPAVIEPNVSDAITLEGTKQLSRSRWEVPAALRNRNMIFEVRGQGLVRSLPIYSSSLTVSLATPVGRLQVLRKNERMEEGVEIASGVVEGPAEGAYVKVFARHADGSIRFHKDGYTDLRGQFDYVSLSAPGLDTVEKFAILVLDPKHGAWIRECDPPNRNGR